MINDLISIFRKLDEKYEDNVVIDRYQPSPGLYMKIDKNFKWEDPFVIAQKHEDTTSKQYLWFRRADYYSKLIDMNKPVDPKKKIHSNNYLTLFIKKEILPIVGEDNKNLSIEEFKESIKRYFRMLLMSDDERYKDKKTLELISTMHLPKLPVKSVERNMEFLLDNIQKLITLIQEISFNKKEYIKIFFEEDFEIYKQENERYIIPKIYNKNDYNVLIKDKVLGLSNDNMGLNSKKPYLQHHSTPFKVAFRLDVRDALISKKVFEWLNCQNKNTIYIPEEILNDSENMDEIVTRDLTRTSGDGAYYYIYFTRGTGTTIEDFDYIPNIRERIDFKLKNYLNIKEIAEELVDKRHQLEALVDGYWFNGRLKNSYYMLPKVKDGEFTKQMLSLLTISRKAFHQFLIKSDDRSIKNVINKVSLGLVKEQLFLSEKISSLKVAKAYNLRLSLLEYLNIKVRGVHMGSRILEMMDEISEKISKEKTTKIKTDEEFFFISGQMAYYLLYQSEKDKNNKKFDMAEPFFRSSNAEILKKQLINVFKLYSHKVFLNSRRAKNAMSMVMDYKTDSKFTDYEDVFLAGLMANNLLLEKKEA